MSGNKRSTPEATVGSGVPDTDESPLEDAGSRGAERTRAARDGAGGGPASRRPSPSSAASRARRIGGRPAPTSSPRPGDDVDVEPPAGVRPVKLSKPSPTRPRSAGRVAGSTAQGTAATSPSTAATGPSTAAPSPSTAATGPSTVTAGGALPERAARLRRRLTRLRWAPVAVLGVAAVVLLVLLVVVSHGVYWAKQANSSAARDTVQEKVLASAKTCFASLNSYNYRTLDASLAAGLKCTTGKFTSDYRTAFKNEIAANAPTAKATQTAQVNTAGVASISPDGKQWVVLIYGQLQVSNVSTAKKSPRIDPFGAVVTLDEVANQWLISKVGTDVGSGLGN